jgi:hypothetical protein
MADSILSMLKQYLSDAAPSGGLNPEWTPERVRGALSMLADVTPVVGDVKSGVEGVQAAREGDWLGAGLGGLGMLPFVPNMAGSIKGYRGLSREFDPSFKQPIEWFSENKDLAKGYGANVIERELDPKISVDLGLRDYRTEVKKDDVLDRIYRTIVDRFNSKELPKNEAMKLTDQLKSLRGGDEFKPAHQWINSKEMIDLLKGAGYDSLEHVEKGTKTWGVFK